MVMWEGKAVKQWLKWVRVPLVSATELSLWPHLPPSTASILYFSFEAHCTLVDSAH